MEATIEQFLSSVRKTDRLLVLYEDKILDLTTLNHPGGDEVIAKNKGKNVTTLMNASFNHPPSAVKKLLKYQVGRIVQKQPKPPTKKAVRWANQKQQNEDHDWNKDMEEDKPQIQIPEISIHTKHAHL